MEFFDQDRRCEVGEPFVHHLSDIAQEQHARALIVFVAATGQRTGGGARVLRPVPADNLRNGQQGAPIIGGAIIKRGRSYRVARRQLNCMVRHPARSLSAELYQIPVSVGAATFTGWSTLFRSSFTAIERS